MELSSKVFVPGLAPVPSAAGSSAVLSSAADPSVQAASASFSSGEGASEEDPFAADLSEKDSSV